MRIDHPDGLADPQQYFERLSELFPRRWIVVEKILADHEKLPEDWPVHGETGYRFVNLLTGLFIDARGRVALRPHLPALHRRRGAASRRSRTRAAC